MQGDSPVTAGLDTCQRQPQHNRRQGRRGYVTFRGPAGAEGEGSSAWDPCKGLNFREIKRKGAGEVMRMDDRDGRRKGSSQSVTVEKKTGNEG